MDSQFATKVTSLYRTYIEVIKPLLAEIEIRYQKFPIPILNEIRAFNDHIARCHREDISSANIDKEIKKAEGHIYRIILDCYKFLNVAFHENLIEKFDKRTRGVDLNAVNNGQFSASYFETRKFIISHLKKAKFLEAMDKDESLKEYEIVYNKFSELETFLSENERHICWAKARYFSNKIIKAIWWLVAIIFGYILSLILPSIPWDRLFSFFK